MSDSIGSRIIFARGQHKLSQKQLAANIGITRAAISLYEADKIRPREEVITRLADLFNADPAWFETGAGTPPVWLDAPFTIPEITVERLTPEISDLKVIYNGRYWRVPLPSKTDLAKAVALRAPNAVSPINKGDGIVINIGYRKTSSRGVYLAFDDEGCAKLVAGAQPGHMRVIGRVIACLWIL